MNEDQAILRTGLRVFVNQLVKELEALSPERATAVTHDGMAPDTAINTAIDLHKTFINQQQHVALALNVFLRWYRDTTPLKPIEGFRPAKEFIGRIYSYEMVGVDHLVDKGATRLFIRFDGSGHAVCLTLEETLKMLNGLPYDVTRTTTWARIRKL